MLIPALSALLAGASFGLNVHIQARALRFTDAQTGAAISVGMGALLFWLIAPFVIDWGWWSLPAALLFALCGLILPAMGQFLQIKSVRRIGTSLTAAIGSFTPVFAILTSLVLLQEPVTARSALGTLMMICAIILASLRTGKARRDWPIWLLLLPFGAAAARGVVQPIIKIGLETIPSAFFSTLVMFTTSTAVLTIIAFGTRKGTPPAPPRRQGHGWFALSGVLNGAGILSLGFALRHGEVALAAPLASTTPIWAVFFGKLFFRAEPVRPRDIVIAALVVCGAAIIVTG